MYGKWLTELIAVAPEHWETERRRCFSLPHSFHYPKEIEDVSSDDEASDDEASEGEGSEDEAPAGEASDWEAPDAEVRTDGFLFCASCYSTANQNESSNSRRSLVLAR